MLSRSGRCAGIMVLASTLAACATAAPPDPAIGFDVAYAEPANASHARLLAAGGRQLDASSVSAVLERMSRPQALAAVGATPADRLELRADGAVCLAAKGEPSCRFVVADGAQYRLFDTRGMPRGSLTPSPG